MVDSNLPAARHETQDIGLRPLAFGLGLTLLALAGCTMLALWLYPGTVADRRLPTSLPEFPSPRLQQDPPADMQEFLRRERAQLDGTGWVDRAQGIAHIPIAEAMRRVADQGIADWPVARRGAAK